MHLPNPAVDVAYGPGQGQRAGAGSFAAEEAAGKAAELFKIDELVILIDERLFILL